jgi:hypothetical protein
VLSPDAPATAAERNEIVMLGPELSTLRACQDRVLEREGIPMVLALVSEVGTVPAARSDEVRADGERIAAGMDAYREGLLPGMRDDDNGCLISVIQAVAYVDFAGPGVELPASALEQPRNEVGA